MIEPISTQRTNQILSQLNSLRFLLEAQGENLWINGIRAAIHNLSERDGGPDTPGFEKAKLIYNRMMDKGAGFAEYNVWMDDYHKRMRINKPIDDLRNSIWDLFNKE